MIDTVLKSALETCNLPDSSFNGSYVRQYCLCQAHPISRHRFCFSRRSMHIKKLLQLKQRSNWMCSPLSRMEIQTQSLSLRNARLQNVAPAFYWTTWLSLGF